MQLRRIQMGKNDSARQDEASNKIDESQTAMITKTIIETLQSLNLIDNSGKPKTDHVSSGKKKASEKKQSSQLFGDEYKPHVASRFGMEDPGSAFDDVLAESSMLPIFQVEGARKRFSGTNSPGVTQGPMDKDKMRIAGGSGGTAFGQGSSSFMEARHLWVSVWTP